MGCTAACITELLGCHVEVLFELDGIAHTDFVLAIRVELNVALRAINLFQNLGSPHAGSVLVRKDELALQQEGQLDLIEVNLILGPGNQATVPGV